MVAMTGPTMTARTLTTKGMITMTGMTMEATTETMIATTLTKGMT